MEKGRCRRPVPQADLTTAFNQASIPPPTGPNTQSTIGSAGIQTGPLDPGIYEATSSLEVEGALTLNAHGDPDAVWIFQAPASTLTTDVGSSVVLENGAQACNVFWKVGSSLCFLSWLLRPASPQRTSHPP